MVCRSRDQVLQRAYLTNVSSGAPTRETLANPSQHHRVPKCDVIILQFFPFEPLNLIYTAAVRTCAKFQIVSLNESEDREG